jgi:hypothetical protein
MTLLHIEMGQGIVTQAQPNEELQIRTSTLYSCTFITGYNPDTGLAGAFHYPAGMLADPEGAQVRRDMDEWIDKLKPQQVTLVAAHNENAPGMSATPQDVDSLRRWVNQKGDNITLDVKTAVAAGMEVIGGTFNAGNRGDSEQLRGSFESGEGMVDVQSKSAGDYRYSSPENGHRGEVSVFGSNLSPSQGRPSSTLSSGIQFERLPDPVVQAPESSAQAHPRARRPEDPSGQRPESSAQAQPRPQRREGPQRQLVESAQPQPPHREGAARRVQAPVEEQHEPKKCCRVL